MQKVLEFVIVLTTGLLVGAVAGSMSPIPLLQAETHSAVSSYTPTLRVFTDPKHHVICYKDSWAGISVPLSCVYIPSTSR